MTSSYSWTLVGVAFLVTPEAHPWYYKFTFLLLTVATIIDHRKPKHAFAAKVSSDRFISTWIQLVESKKGNMQSK